MDNPNALFLGGSGETTFDEAIVGIARRCSQPSLVVYSVEKVLAVLERSMSSEDAREYFDFNIAGAWFGEHTPLYMSTHDDEEEFTEDQGPSTPRQA